MSIGVVVVDDHAMFAEALVQRLKSEPDISVMGLATSGAAARELVEALRPDVVVLDVELGQEDGISVARALMEAEPAVKVVLLTEDGDGITAAAAVRCGASGFMGKDSTTEEVVAAVHHAHRGEAWVQPRLLRPLLAYLVGHVPPLNADEAKVATLSERERQVLWCMARGLDRAATAKELVVSQHTVRTHIRNLMSKLDAHSSLEAVAIALRAAKGSRRGVHQAPKVVGR